jgi:hypothetical protein
MKLKLFIPVAFLFFVSASFAQISIGGQAGAVFSKPSTKIPSDIPGLTYTIKGLPGFSVGLIADIPIGESGFRVIPELYYVGKGFKADATIDLLGQQIKGETRTNISYIDLPINFAYAFELGNNRLMVGAGPYAGFGLNGKTIAKTTVGDISQDDERDVEFGNGSDQYDRLDIGANFMAAYILNNGLMFKVNYSLGLLNLSNNPDAEYKNRFFGVSLGYFFLQGGK